jgi:DNA (cytosine-5)-methyltransferase 1
MDSSEGAKLRVFTSFTGIGSQEMALRNIGIDFEVVGTSEVDKYAILAYDAIHNNQEYVPPATKAEMLAEIKNKNIAYCFSTGKSQLPRNDKELKHLYEAHIRNKNYGDIQLIDELPDFDLFTYSFPCKNISQQGQQAGLKTGSGTQSSLLWECEKIITEKRPKYLLMENVKHLVSKNHIDDFQVWIDKLDEIGYNSYWDVLNGKDFGVAQNRERVMMISILKAFDEGYEFPDYEGTYRQIGDILESTVPARCYLPPERYEGIQIDEIDKPIHELIQVGHLNGKRHATRRVYSIKGLCPTLTSMNGGDREPKIHIGNGVVRKLTPLECWRVMGFADEDYYASKNIGNLPISRLYERSGRGIVLPMLEGLFRNMLNPPEKKTKEDMPQLASNGLTILDCFCGFGVGAIGAERAGFNTIYAFDNNKHAVRNFNKNIANVAQVIDANNLELSDLPDADIITGGFPCKPWSVNGKREGSADKKHGNLAQKLIEIILHKKPKAFLIENVKGLVSKHNKPFFLDMIEDLKDGYNVYWDVLNCAEYGVPQKRERVFIIGIKEEYKTKFSFPKKSKKMFSIRDAFEGLPDFPDGVNNHEYHEKWTIRNDEKPYIHKIPEGGNWKDLPEEDARAFMKGAYNSSGGKTTYLAVMDRDKPSRTIMSSPMGKNSAQILNFGNGNIRRYTVRESLRLQTVPDEYGFDTETPIRVQYERCSGIPTLMSYKLMKNIARCLEGKKKFPVVRKYPVIRYSPRMNICEWRT